MALSFTMILTLTYGAVGLMGACAYIPQYLKLRGDNSRSDNMPLATWVMWGVQGQVVCLYAVVVNKDPMFCLLAVLGMLGANACLGALVYNRYFRVITPTRRAEDVPVVTTTAAAPAATGGVQQAA